VPFRTGLADLPFLFKDEPPRAAPSTALRRVLAQHIEAKMNCRVLGFFENGFRHISNSLRPVRAPADLAGMRLRILNSKTQLAASNCSRQAVHVGLAKLIAALKMASSTLRKIRWPTQ